MAGRRRTERGRLIDGEPRSEVQDELAFHLEQRVREYMAAGMDEKSARQAALERIGDVDRVSGECADILTAERRTLARRNWFSDMLQDLRFAMRSSMRAPLFTLMAVITLALGIGANSAVFGLVKSVLLNPLPYADAERLVRVQGFREAQGASQQGGVSAGTAQDFVERQRSFSDVAFWTTSGRDAVLQGDDGASTARLAWVTPTFFQTLGVSPLIGRVFDDAEASADTAQVIILSHAIWQQQYGGQQDVLGRTIILNGLPRTVVGVLPPGFVHPVERSDVYMPLNLAPWLRDPVAARGSHFLAAFARMNPGVTLESANADVAAIGAALAEEHPRDNGDVVLRARPLRETMAGETRTPLLVLMGSALLVLIIACANLAAALLSRTIARRKEFAVRVSLGAGRGRLVRQLLAESVLLAAVGGLAGLLLAMLALGALRGAGIDVLPPYAELTLDTGAIAFTFLLALVTGAAFGLTPALSAGRGDTQATLRDEARGGTGGRGASRARGLLVAGQVALCLSVLAGAGLLTRSLMLMASEPLGFEPRNTLAFDVPLPAARYPTVASQLLFFDEMRERIGALPGVRDVAVVNMLPTRFFNSNSVYVLGTDRPEDGAAPIVLTTGVLDDAFTTLGVAVLAGRVFTPADNPDSPPVAVVSETMARRFWPDGNAIGARIRIGPDPTAPPREVIGIVRDVRTSLVEPVPEPMLYVALRQGWFGGAFIVRTEGDPIGHINPVRSVLAAYDPALPMAGITTLDDVVSQGLAGRRLPMTLMLGFGILALLLACIGVYALFANMAASREREFGVRMALGSTRGAVAALVLRQGALWLGLGLLGGAAGVYVISRALRSLVYGIAPLDPVSIAGAVAVLVVCAAMALALPVRRATRADPAASMR
jgi:putative ABC transport system permease protein